MRHREYPIIKFKKLDPKAIIPAYATDGSAGFDFHVLERTIVRSGNIRLVRTGLACEIPPGWHMEVRPRSGLACRIGIYIPNAPGTIDSDYRGEIKIPVQAIGPDIPFIAGERIAQGVMVRAPQFEIIEVDDLAPSARGEGGFGSTGNR